MTTIEQLGFRRMLRQRGRAIKCLSGPSAGKTFRGTINRIGAFELVTDLGADPRGRRVLEHALDPALIIQSQNKIQDLATNETYTVVNIGLDAPVYSKKYELQQLTVLDS